MKRLLQKKIILPIKFKRFRKKRAERTDVRPAKEIWEKLEDMQKELHKNKRMNDKMSERKTEGYIQALTWVCQEQKESKQ